MRPLPLRKLVDNFEAQYEYVANEGTLFTLKTNLQAPRYRYDPVMATMAMTFLLPQAAQSYAWHGAGWCAPTSAARVIPAHGRMSLRSTIRTFSNGLLP